MRQKPYMLTYSIPKGSNIHARINYQSIAFNTKAPKIVLMTHQSRFKEENSEIWCQPSTTHLEYNANVVVEI